ncbi:MAG TPA: hypothetical protein VK284_13940 [Streptosporangiaceae bacterium]|nr:hypothetical protein [Streptosporangiaceae bacterium]HLN67263.1 hypothetical protein [Streptosporangiaceae bacterium]
MEASPGENSVGAGRLHIAEGGQRLIAYCAVPGSATAAAFRELAARSALPA